MVSRNIRKPIVLTVYYFHTSMPLLFLVNILFLVNFLILPWTNTIFLDFTNQQQKFIDNSNHTQLDKITVAKALKKCVSLPRKITTQKVFAFNLFKFLRQSSNSFVMINLRLQIRELRRNARLPARQSAVTDIRSVIYLIPRVYEVKTQT